MKLFVSAAALAGTASAFTVVDRQKENVSGPIDCYQGNDFKKYQCKVFNKGANKALVDAHVQPLYAKDLNNKDNTNQEEFEKECMLRNFNADGKSDKYDEAGMRSDLIEAAAYMGPVDKTEGGVTCMSWIDAHAGGKCVDFNCSHTAYSGDAGGKGIRYDGNFCRQKKVGGQPGCINRHSGQWENCVVRECKISETDLTGWEVPKDLQTWIKNDRKLAEKEPPTFKCEAATGAPSYCGDPSLCKDIPAQKDKSKCNVEGRHLRVKFDVDYPAKEGELADRTKQCCKAGDQVNLGAPSDPIPNCEKHAGNWTATYVNFKPFDADEVGFKSKTACHYGYDAAKNPWLIGVHDDDTGAIVQRLVEKDSKEECANFCSMTVGARYMTFWSDIKETTDMEKFGYTKEYNVGKAFTRSLPHGKCTAKAGKDGKVDAEHRAVCRRHSTKESCNAKHTSFSGKFDEDSSFDKDVECEWKPFKASKNMCGCFTDCIQKQTAGIGATVSGQLTAGSPTTYKIGHFVDKPVSAAPPSPSPVKYVAKPVAIKKQTAIGGGSGRGGGGGRGRR